MSNRPVASVSLDVDNLWSYLKTRGDAGWKSRPSYLDRFVPLVLESLHDAGAHITCFLVGADAVREENAAALRSLVEAGHEVGNHSFEHEPWLHRYSPEEVRQEIASAESAIERATGQRPLGFRGPGFSWSPVVLQALVERGYLYDASTLPTFLGPLARAYYFRSAGLSATERQDRALLFGRFSDGWRPNTPYQWALADGGRLLEIPVTTMPVTRSPFHLSYLLYLARISEGLMTGYLTAALALCRIHGVEPSFLLHPLDLLGGDAEPRLRFFPGMDLPTERKRRLFARVLGILGERYRLVPMSEHARLILGRGAMESRLPALAA